MSNNFTSDFLPGKRQISLEAALQGRTLTTRVRFSRDIRRFFRSNSFALRYSDEIHAGDGLLSIPGLALLLPVAWLAGANVSVKRLDRTYARAAESLQRGYKDMYPGMPCGIRLEADELVDSPPNPDGAALLFSGGMDATYSFFANRHLKPHLLQVYGTEFPCSEKRFLEMLKTESSCFASRHGVKISFVETDFRSCVDERALYHAFARASGRSKCTLWNGVGFAMGFLGIAAPFSAGRFDHLLLSAWASSDRADSMKENPSASSPRMDEKAAWANLRVEHHGCLHRFEKAREMKEWLDDQPLRVCWRFDDPSQADGMMNCSCCEKCSRTIVALAVAGVDPSKCGFTIDDEAIHALWKRIEKRQLMNSHLALWWEPMQQEIPEKLEGDCFGLRGFLEWFREFDLVTGEDPKPSPFTLDGIFTRCPYPLALAVRSMIYGVLGEPHWMNRPETLPPEPE